MYNLVIVLKQQKDSIACCLRQNGLILNTMPLDSRRKNYEIAYANQAKYLRINNCVFVDLLAIKRDGQA